MDEVVEQFRQAARLGREAGFDWLELHCAHGYLLSAFISPISNRRRDGYGGALNARLRFPLEVLEAVREVWPDERPLSARISATDWLKSGVTGEDSVEIARAMTAAGADIIHVSAGQTSTRARPVYGRMFQTPFSRSNPQRSLRAHDRGWKHLRKPIMSTAFWPPGAPISAPWRGRI